MMYSPKKQGGYTLIELMVAIGLFAIVMTLASGSYIMMISISRQAQGIASGIDNLSFALETMTRDIRTGSNYSCGTALGMGDCIGGGNSFTFKNEKGDTVKYDLDSSAIAIRRTVNNSVESTLTDSSSVVINSLMFYAFGTAPVPNTTQARVTIIIKGTVSPDKNPQVFTIETSATMRGSDI